jgi:branched-chain amino acid transport system ATP-binding protein
MSVLETRSVSIRFGGVFANTDVSISVGEWEIVGIIGPNGAGKTTAFNIITGFYKPDRGRVVYKGRDVTNLSVHERTALGMGRTFQNVGLVKGSTVRENFVSAQYLEAEYSTLAGMLGAPSTFASERTLRARGEAIADVMGLGELLDRQVAGLPYGVLKRVEIATVLATDPDVLLLDEPSSGMGPEEAHALGERLLKLRSELNLTVLMIEHHVPLVVGVCDYVYVLNFGKVLTQGVPSEVQTHPEVIAAYLGGEAEKVGVAAAPVEEAVDGTS